MSLIVHAKRMATALVAIITLSGCISSSKDIRSNLPSTAPLRIGAYVNVIDGEISQITYSEGTYSVKNNKGEISLYRFFQIPEDRTYYILQSVGEDGKSYRYISALIYEDLLVVSTTSFADGKIPDELSSIVTGSGRIYSIEKPDMTLPVLRTLHKSNPSHQIIHVLKRVS